MSQHDYVISNDIGSAVRADINNALGAIATINSGATEPSTTYAYQLWMDTSSNVLKIRNSANSAWYTLPISPVANNTVDINGGTIDGVTLGASSAITSAVITSADINGGTIDGVTLGASSAITSAVITSADINGGTIDGVTIGGSSAGAGTFTNLTATGTASVAGASTFNSGNADVDFTVNGDNGKALLIDGTTNDISFYEDTGTTAKFFWDASAESLGIGTTSPSAQLDVNGEVIAMSGSGTADRHIEIGTGRTGNGNSYIDFISDTTYTDYGARFIRYNTGANATTRLDHRGTGELSLWASDAGALQFGTNDTERMRIDSSGNVVLQTAAAGFETANYPTYGVRISQEGSNIGRITIYSNSAGAFDAARFFNSNGQVGSISVGGSATSYNTSSDYRLKEDWQPMSGSIDRLKALNPVNFAWKVDGRRVDGFLAHEAQEVVPEAVTGTKDAVEAIGNVTDAEGTVVQENVTEPAELAEGQTWTKTEDRPVYQGIDQAKLVPLLTAALQEAVSKIEALETRIAALEA